MLSQQIPCPGQGIGGGRLCHDFDRLIAPLLADARIGTIWVPWSERPGAGTRGLGPRASEALLGGSLTASRARPVAQLMCARDLTRAFIDIGSPAWSSRMAVARRTCASAESIVSAASPTCRWVTGASALFR